MTLDSGSIRFVRIFAFRGGSQDLCKFSLDFMPAPVYYVYTCVRHAVFIIKFNCFVYDIYLPIRLLRVVKCVTSGDVASGIANVIRRVFGIRGKTADL